MTHAIITPGSRSALVPGRQHLAERAKPPAPAHGPEGGSPDHRLHEDVPGLKQSWVLLKHGTLFKGWRTRWFAREREADSMPPAARPTHTLTFVFTLITSPARHATYTKPRGEAKTHSETQRLHVGGGHRHTGSTDRNDHPSRAVSQYLPYGSFSARTARPASAWTMRTPDAIVGLAQRRAGTIRATR